MGEEPLWTVTDVAQFLSVTTKTVRAWQLEHKLPFLKIGGTVRFVPAEIRTWATNHAVVSGTGGGFRLHRLGGG